MKNRSLKLLTGTAILATLLLSGCGGGADNSITKQPHDTSKLGRTVAIEKDWTWDVSFSLIKLDDTTVVQAHFWEGVPKDLKNFQVFVDLDNDENTGYSGSDGWEIHGADYLIENGQVYKSQSTTQWKWEYIDLFKDLHLFSAGVGKYGKFDWRTSTAKIDNIFNADSFKVMIEAYDANWKGDCNTITGIVADVTGVDTGADDTNTTGSTNEKKVLVSKSVDKDNDGAIDLITNYTYYDNGKLKTKSSNGRTDHYNDHGDLVRYGFETFDRYRYFYNDDNKIEKKETLNEDGTVKSYVKYEYNSEGKVTNKEILKSNGTIIYERYEFNSHGDAVVVFFLIEN